MNRVRPTFYAATGSRRGDLVAVLHPPYTVWHLSYVAIGASLASEVNWLRLIGTLLAFALGTGVAAHALDELHDRPLRTGFSDRVLVGAAVTAYAAALAVAAVGAIVISPWVLAWALAGIALATGYALAWPSALHTGLGFALTWGAFPVLVGSWAQTESLSIGALLLSAAAAVLSFAQRELSTPARMLRRKATSAETRITGPTGVEYWSYQRLLATLENPLRILMAATVLLATGLLVANTLRAGG